MSNNLEIKLRKYINNCVPGYVDVLNSLSLKRYGKSIIALFFENPVEVYRLLLDYHRDEFTASFIMKNLFIKPIALEINNLEWGEELFTTIKDGLVEKAKALVNKIVKNLNNDNYYNHIPNSSSITMRSANIAIIPFVFNH